MAEEIDLDNLDRDREAEEAAGEQEEETSFTDDRRPGDESILIIDGSNPLFTRPDAEEEDIGPGDNTLEEIVIQNTKQFLKNGLGITVNKGDGSYSTVLYDELIVTKDKNNKINGAKYKGKKILFLRGGKMMYSKDKSKESYVNVFKKILEKAHGEHQKTPAALAERRVGVDLPQEAMDNIIDNVSDRIESEINDEIEDFVTNIEITNNELRELRGILNVKDSSGENKLEALKVESEHWKKEAEKEGGTLKFYDAMTKVADLKADQIRLRMNQLPESERVKEMVEEEAEVNDMTRFEKFKNWARENLTGLAVVAISIAGIITL